IESVNTMEMNRLHRLQGNIFRVWEEHFGLSPINLSYLKSNDSSQADPWQSYVLTKYRDLQMYNCWHEDRIAAANHIENRVPFLDHRLVEWV
ncbi:asparagine synthase-related protein, partial [Enterococcus faecalis]